MSLDGTSLVCKPGNLRMDFIWSPALYRWLFWEFFLQHSAMNCLLMSQFYIGYSIKEATTQNQLLKSLHIQKQDLRSIYLENPRELWLTSRDKQTFPSGLIIVGWGGLAGYLPSTTCRAEASKSSLDFTRKTPFSFKSIKGHCKISHPYWTSPVKLVLNHLVDRIL